MTRRQFLATASAGALASAVPGFAFARPQETIRIGLIGCGGRGTGAAIDALTGSPGVELVAMGDVFRDRVEGSAKTIRENKPDGFKVTPERMFVGLDSYEKVIDSGVDLVILTAPPVFRPSHLEYAVKAGKHVFMEKPVAVDGAGVRSIFESSDLAASKGLGIVAGTQRRHQNNYRETMRRIHDGAIGEITSLRAYWNQGGLWAVPRTPAMSDLEWQLRNWLYFCWISGDHILEQHIHNIDVCMWAIQKVPVKAVSHGGREVRTAPLYGHIYDHFATELHFDNGVVMHTYCRQIDGTVANVSEFIHGTKGTSNGASRIWGESAYRFDGPNPNPYVQEHTHLVSSIRAGQPLNEGRQVAESSLAAIMGRLAGYTGLEVTREQALATKSMMPANLSWDMKLEVPPVPVPGRTRLEEFM